MSTMDPGMWYEDDALMDGLTEAVARERTVPEHVMQAAKDTFAGISEGAIQLSDQQASCFVTAYAASGQPRFWALGLGVAGGFNGGPGVLAGHNKNTRVLSNNKGIDHFEDSPIIPAVFGAADSCGIDLSGLE